MTSDAAFADRKRYPKPHTPKEFAMKTIVLSLAVLTTLSSASYASWRDRTPNESRFGFANEQVSETSGSMDLQTEGFMVEEAASGPAKPAAGQNVDPHRFNWGGRS